MKKIVYTLGILLGMLWGDCVHLSTQPIAMCQDGTIQIDPMSAKFNQSLSFAQNSVIDIPLYLAVDSNKSSSSPILLQLHGDTKLKQANQEPITIKYYYVQGGQMIPIYPAQPFTILQSHRGKLSNKIGDIRLVVEKLVHNESAGRYSASLIASIQKGNISASSTIQISAKIDEVIRVSFEDNVATLGEGVGFMGAKIDLGSVFPHERAQKSLPVYIKNNTPAGCTMSIVTEPLKHILYSKTPSIPLYFTYTPIGGIAHKIINNKSFDLTHSKNSGKRVGTFHVDTNRLNKNYLAGQYEANIAVTIKAR